VAGEEVEAALQEFIGVSTTPGRIALQRMLWGPPS